MSLLTKRQNGYRVVKKVRSCILTEYQVQKKFLWFWISVGTPCHTLPEAYQKLKYWRSRDNAYEEVVQQ